MSLPNYKIPSLLIVVWHQDTDWMAICRSQQCFWPKRHYLEEQARGRYCHIRQQAPCGNGIKFPWYLQSHLLCPFPHLLLILNVSVTWSFNKASTQILYSTKVSMIIISWYHYCYYYWRALSQALTRYVSIQKQWLWQLGEDEIEQGQE